MAEKHSASPTSHDTFFHGLGHEPRFPPPRPSDRYPLFCLYRAQNLTVAITSVVLGLLTASARWAPLIAPPRDDHAIDARTVGAKARDFPVHGRFRAYDAPRRR